MNEHDRPRHGRWHERSFPVKLLLVVAGIAFVCGIVVLVGFILMWLWNWLMPVIFHLPLIGFWQALGLLALATILFKRPHSVGRVSREQRRKRAFRDRLRETSNRDEAQHQEGV